MHDIDFHQGQPVTSPRRTSGLAWLAAIVVVLLFFGFFVVKPLVERAATGAATVLSMVLQAIAQSAEMGFETACDHVRQSPLATDLLGEPLRFAPFEQTEWLDTHGRNELELKFAVTGPKGAGVAHVVLVPTEAGFEVKSADLAGPGGEVVELPLLLP